MGQDRGKKPGKGITRREFLKISAGGAAGVAMAPYLSPRPALAQKPIRIACISIFTGRSAVLGNASKNGIEMYLDQVNSKGGILGRKVEVTYRDTRAKLEEAVRLAREAASSEGFDFIINGTSSQESFALKEAARDLKRLVLTIQSKTTELTADPKTFTPYHFRFCAQNIHDMAAGAKYAADLSKKNGWKRWAMVAPDYAYGRENVMYFTEFLKSYYPEMEIVTEAWPKLYEPDFTPYITKILQAKVQACFTSQWGGDIVALLEQGGLYGFWDKVKIFSIDLGDFSSINPIMKSFGKFPEGLYMGTRANPVTPDTKTNQDWFNGYVKKYNYEPTGWDQQAYTCMLFLQKAIEKAGSTDNEAIIKALEGLEVVGPWGTPPSQKMKMRAKDHTLILYTEAWGKTTSKMPYVSDVLTLPWDEIEKTESGWLKKKGWL